jgi:hypothetical protein
LPSPPRIFFDVLLKEGFFFNARERLFAERRALTFPVRLLVTPRLETFRIVLDIVLYYYDKTIYQIPPGFIDEDAINNILKITAFIVTLQKY